MFYSQMMPNYNAVGQHIFEDERFQGYLHNLKNINPHLTRVIRIIRNVQWHFGGTLNVR